MAKQSDSSFIWIALGAAALWLYSRNSAAPAVPASPAPVSPGTPTWITTPGSRELHPLPPIRVGYQEGDSVTLPQGQQPPKSADPALYWTQAVVGNPQEGGDITWTLRSVNSKGVDPRYVY